MDRFVWSFVICTENRWSSSLFDSCRLERCNIYVNGDLCSRFSLRNRIKVKLYFETFLSVPGFFSVAIRTAFDVVQNIQHFFRTKHHRTRLYSHLETLAKGGLVVWFFRLNIVKVITYKMIDFTVCNLEFQSNFFPFFLWLFSNIAGFIKISFGIIIH